jgi:type IV secretory pathway VirD2 relaxase
VPAGRVRDLEHPASAFPHSLRKVLRSVRARPPALPRIGTPLPRHDSRQVSIKLRYVQVGGGGGPGAGEIAVKRQRAVSRQLSYLEREGVERDGSPGHLYDAAGAADRSSFEPPIEGEEHQFHLIVSPDDGDQLDMQAYIRSYMAIVEKDLRQKLRWVAANHYNTEKPHAHVLIRGIDADGAEVRFDREYVSYGLRRRAMALATDELGPRPERERQAQREREVALERYTALDATLERLAVNGVFKPATARVRSRQLAHALKERLLALEKLGLATRSWRGTWRLDPRLRPELAQRRARAEALRTVAQVLPNLVERCTVVLRDHPKERSLAEIDRGVQGIIRWKGLDERGQFCAVIETTRGTAYHLPISARVADDVRVGQVFDLYRAIDKDEQIETAARGKGWTYDVALLPERQRDAYRGRLEQLERMGLAKPDGSSRWRLHEDFRSQVDAFFRRTHADDRIQQAARSQDWVYDLDTAPNEEREAYRGRLEQLEHMDLARRETPSRWRLRSEFARQLTAAGKQQPYWQMLGLRPSTQPIREQVSYDGPVWLDGVRANELGSDGFGARVKAALERRHAYVRRLGLDPSNPKLRWQLSDLQQANLERSIAHFAGGKPVAPVEGFTGTAQVHRAPNGQVFVEVRRRDDFIVRPVYRDADRKLEGRIVRIALDAKRRVQLQAVGPEQQPEPARAPQRRREGPDRGS